MAWRVAGTARKSFDSRAEFGFTPTHEIHSDSRRYSSVFCFFHALQLFRHRPNQSHCKTEDDKLTPELKITTNLPPTFSWMAGDDPVRVENAVFYALAL